MPAQPVSKPAIRRFAPVARGPSMARRLLRRYKLRIAGAIISEMRGRITMPGPIVRTSNRVSESLAEGCGERSRKA
jgi:hypothetical protein